MFLNVWCEFLVLVCMFLSIFTSAISCSTDSFSSTTSPAYRQKDSVQRWALVLFFPSTRICSDSD